MTIFPIIQVLSVVLNLTNGLNETNSLTHLTGSSSSSLNSEVQPYPLGHPSVSPVISDSHALTPQSSENSNVFPYLMNRPIFTESLKSSTEEASGQHKQLKESNSGWKNDDSGKWSKHGDEQESEKQRHVNSEGSTADGSHKKSSGHDNRDAAEKWKQGSEANEHEDEKLVEEYNKNKGRMYEKKWSWEKERGSGHGWENQGHRDQDHLKGSNQREYESGSKGSQGKEGWSQEKKKSNKFDDNWASKFNSKGSKGEAKDSHLNHVSGMNQFDDAHYLQQFGYL